MVRLGTMFMKPIVAAVLICTAGGCIPTFAYQGKADKLEADLAANLAEYKALLEDIDKSVDALNAPKSIPPRAGKAKPISPPPVPAAVRAAALDVRSSLTVGLTLPEFRVKVQRFATEIALARDHDASGNKLGMYDLARKWYSVSLWAWASRIEFAERAPGSADLDEKTRDDAWAWASALIDKAK
jgi:hypothetical protein